MSVFSPDRRIKFFFLRHRSCGLKLPNGWFGRPYDNRLSLVEVEIHDDALVIELITLCILFSMASQPWNQRRTDSI